MERDYYNLPVKERPERVNLWPIAAVVVASLTASCTTTELGLPVADGTCKGAHYDENTG